MMNLRSVVAGFKEVAANVSSVFTAEVKPLSAAQLGKLGNLETAYTKKRYPLKIVPGKQRISHLPLYMIVLYRGVPIAEVFSNKVKDLPFVTREEVKPEDYVKVESVIDALRELFH